MNTTTGRIPVMDAVSPIKYQVDAFITDPHSKSQHSCLKGTGEKIATAPGYHQPFTEKHIPSPLAPWTLATAQKTYL